jgi:hypothetical protein
MKTARLANHDGVVKASWGNLEYTKGNDYIVRHGPGDYGVVKTDIFAKTYHIPTKGKQNESNCMVKRPLPLLRSSQGPAQTERY